MNLLGTPSVQSPKAYDLANLTGPKIGLRLAGYRYSVSPAEALAGLSASDLMFGYDEFDLRRYGLAVGASAATNTTAIANAVLVALQYGTAGATLVAPSGAFNINSIPVPALIQIVGRGAHATKFTYGGNGVAFVLGDSGGLDHACGVRRLAIINTDNAGSAVKAVGTTEALIEDLYIEQPVSAGRSGYGVWFDGKNIGSFFNRVKNVTCNHVQMSFYQTTSGAAHTTCNYYDNCSAFGDEAAVAGGSVGFAFTISEGNGTIVTGGNVEDLHEAISLVSASKITWIGVRNEGNCDIDIAMSGAGFTPQTFVSLENFDAAKISDTTGVEHTVIGCDSNNSALFLPNVLRRTLSIRGRAVTDIELKLRAFFGQTADIFQALDWNDDTLFSVGADGSINCVTGVGVKIIAGTGGNPEGVVTAGTGSLYLDQANGGAYLKITGAGNTGWKSVTHA